MTKICTKCKKELDLSCFHKDKYNKDGFACWCKDCRKQYQKDKRDEILKQRKQYRKDTFDQRKIYDNGFAIFGNFIERLQVFEEVRQCPENLKLLEVKCAYCGQWFCPTNQHVKNRIQAFNGRIRGENRFYCSENCKQSCPTYNQNKYPKGFKQATSREVVPLLRQLVLKRDNYTCQKCGATIKTAQLHVHHIIPYAQNKMQANDPDSCITFCKECHKKTHQQDGCRYVDLKC